MKIVHLEKSMKCSNTVEGWKKGNHGVFFHIWEDRSRSKAAIYFPRMDYNSKTHILHIWFPVLTEAEVDAHKTRRKISMALKELLAPEKYLCVVSNDYAKRGKPRYSVDYYCTAADLPRIENADRIADICQEPVFFE